jgi:hypothetical protein
MDKVDIKVDTGESSKVDIRKCPLWQAVSFNDRAFGVSNVHPGASKGGHFALRGHAAVFLNVHFVHIGAFLAKEISCPFCPFSKAP